jgi:nucleotide-binding universal stress UspA family protein
VRALAAKFARGEAVLKNQKIGVCLSSYVLDHHAEILIMGSYGRSRFQGFVLGGATRAFIAQAALLVFLSHWGTRAKSTLKGCAND